MEIHAFGYLGLGSSNLDDWTTFATATIGMQSVDRASSMRAFRMDDRKQRLFIDRAIEPGTQVFGWEVTNATAMHTPSDIYVECGWGGREVGHATPPVEMTTRQLLGP